MNGVLGFSLNSASGYTNLAAIFRFAADAPDTGLIDARNGANYTYDQAIPYSAGQSYHVRMVIDPSTQTYSVYVTPPGGSEIALATNYAFRSEQAGTSSLNNWATYSEVGTLTACNMAITSQSGGSGGSITLSAAPTSLAFGNVNINSNSSQSVTLTNSGSSNVTISSVATGGAGFSSSGVSGGLILNPGQKATLTVTFAPSSAGSVTGSVTITSNATNSPAKITLTGTGTTVTAHSVLLQWSASGAPVTGYNIYRSAISGSGYTKLNSSPMTVTQYTDSTVQDGTTYYYVSTAVDSTGESGFSPQVTAVIPAN
jgi:hypothetical protein